MQSWPARCGDTRSRRPARSPSLPRSASAGTRSPCSSSTRASSSRSGRRLRQSDRGAPRDPRRQGQERNHSRRSWAVARAEDNAAERTQMARVLRRVVVDTGPIVSVAGRRRRDGDRVGAGRTRLRRHGGHRRRGSGRLDPASTAHRSTTHRRRGRFVADVARPIPATRPLAERAALIRARHYHRRDRDVSLADCFALAAAPGRRRRDVGHGDRAGCPSGGVDVIALPNPRDPSSRRRKIRACPT